MEKPKQEILLALIIVMILLGGVAFLVNKTSQPLHLRPTQRHQAWTKNDLGRVQSWLTFDYLNFVFRLPPTYLESQLPAPDSKYPNISIEAYADRHKLDHLKFLEEVRSAIGNYLNYVSPS